MRFLVAAALLLAVPAGAQTPLRATAPDGFKFTSHEAIDKSVSMPESGRTYNAAIMNDHENYYVEFVKRVDHGNIAEAHAHWADYITITSGEGVLTFGGTLGDAKDAGLGEVHGSIMTGASTQVVHAGDYLQIPPGMPHKFDAAPGKTLVYVVFKART